MRRYAVLLSIALGAAGCANDYDQFDFQSNRPADGVDVWVPDDPDARRPRWDSGWTDGGDEDASDAGADATSEQPDAGDDGSAPGDAGADVEPMDDGSDGGDDAVADDGSTGDEGGMVDDAGVGDDAASDDVSVGTDAEGDDAAAPDASIGDEPVDVDASPGDETPTEADITCGPTQKRCGDGCVELDDPSTGCASPSCNPCALPNAAVRCSSEGKCEIDVCAAGFDDCNALADDGCEISLATDVAHCGACRRACSDTHTASRECAGGVCVSPCLIGFANCDRPLNGPDNGCERPVDQDTSNCGSCGNDCHAQGGGLVCGITPNQCGCADHAGCRVGSSTGSCESSTGLCRCGPSTCRSGETCIATAGPDTCSCNGGRACAEGQTCCQTPSGCRDVRSDPGHCGACGRACPRGFFCSEGSCACNADAQCNAGSPGTCAAGQCVCSGTTCGPGRRCLPDGQCG